MSALSNKPSATDGAAPGYRRDEPLGLTVHSLPAPEAMDVHARRTRAGRWKMLGLALVCAAPVLASYFSYYVLRPEGRTAYGTLIEPQRPIPEGASGADLNGQPFALASLKGQWLLVSVGGGACDARCESNLYLQRQLRESLGRDKDRMDRVWLVSDGVRVPEALRPALSQATVVRVPLDVLNTWLKAQDGHALSDHLYVVDPQGHWMMRFPPALDTAGAAKAKRDLTRLMRASASWDKAGR